MQRHLREQMVDVNADEQHADTVCDATKRLTGDSAEMTLLSVAGKHTIRQPLVLADTIHYPIAKFYA